MRHNATTANYLWPWLLQELARRPQPINVYTVVEERFRLEHNSAIHALFALQRRGYVEGVSSKKDVMVSVTDLGREALRELEPILVPGHWRSGKGSAVENGVATNWKGKLFLKDAKRGEEGEDR